MEDIDKLIDDLVYKRRVGLSKPTPNDIQYANYVDPNNYTVPELGSLRGNMDNTNNNFSLDTDIRGVDPSLAYDMLNKYINARNNATRVNNIQNLLTPAQLALGRYADNKARERMAYQGVALQNPYLGQMASSTRAPYGQDVIAQQLAMNKANADELVKKIQDINAMQGNIAAAQEAGVDPAVAFASKDQLSTLAGLKKADIGAQAKRDVAQTYFDKAKYVQDAKTKIADLDRQFKYYKAKGDWSNALRIQAMKGAVQQNVANVMAGARIQGAGINALSNYLGMQDDIPSQADMSKVIEVLKQYPEIFKQ